MLHLHDSAKVVRYPRQVVTVYSVDFSRDSKDVWNKEIIIYVKTTKSKKNYFPFSIFWSTSQITSLVISLTYTQYKENTISGAAPAAWWRLAAAWWRDFSASLLDNSHKRWLWEEKALGVTGRGKPTIPRKQLRPSLPMPAILAARTDLAFTDLTSSLEYGLQKRSSFIHEVQKKNIFVTRPFRHAKSSLTSIGAPHSSHFAYFCTTLSKFWQWTNLRPACSQQSHQVPESQNCWSQ